jgi:hypothetical protein
MSVPWARQLFSQGDISFYDQGFAYKFVCIVLNSYAEKNSVRFER